MDDLTPFLNELNGLLSQIDSSGRRQLAIEIGRELRRVNQGRIKSQVNPDGTPFVPRKSSRQGQKGVARVLRNEVFTYHGQKRKIVNAYKDEGDIVMGYDSISGGFRRFYKDAIIPPSGANWGLRKGRGKIRAMFVKLRTSSYLRVNANPNSVVLQFLGRAGTIADAHHYGRTIGKARLPSRKLLGLPEADKQLIKDLTIAHLAKGLKK